MKEVILPVNVPVCFLSLVPKEHRLGEFSATLSRGIFGKGIFVHIDISIYTLTQKSIDSMSRLQLVKSEEGLKEVKRLVHITGEGAWVSMPGSTETSLKDLDFDTFLATILAYESFDAHLELKKSSLLEHDLKFEVKWTTVSGKKCSILFRKSESYSTGEIFFQDENHTSLGGHPFGNMFTPILSGRHAGGYGQFYGTIL